MSFLAAAAEVLSERSMAANVDSNHDHDLSMVAAADGSTLCEFRPFKKKRSVSFSAPDERDEWEVYALTAIMREAKTKICLVKWRASICHQAQLLMEATSSAFKKGNRLQITIPKRCETALAVKFVHAEHHPGRGHKFSVSSCIDIALEEGMSAATVAQVHGCHRTFVTMSRRVIASVACDLLKHAMSRMTLNGMLGALVSDAKAAVDHVHKPFSPFYIKYSFRQIRFDETKQLIRTSVGRQCQNESAWNLMQLTRDYLIGSIVDIGGETTLFEWPVSWSSLHVTIPCSGTNASVLHDAILRHPSQDAYNQMDARLSCEANVDFLHFTLDGGSPNWKFVNWLMQSTELHHQTCVSVKSCSTHDQSLIEGSLAGTLDLPLVPDLFTTATFVQMGHHFIRLNQRLAHAITPHVLTEQPTNWHSRVLVDLQLVGQFCYCLVHKYGSVGDLERESKMQRHLEQWAALATIVEISADSRQYLWIKTSAPHQSANLAVAQISDHLRSCVLYTKVSPPASSKWTKLLPAIGWFLRVWCACDFPRWTLIIQHPLKHVLQRCDIEQRSAFGLLVPWIAYFLLVQGRLIHTATAVWTSSTERMLRRIMLFAVSSSVVFNAFNVMRFAAGSHRFVALAMLVEVLIYDERGHSLATATK